jgi:hypothetical protein
MQHTNKNRNESNEEEEIARGTKEGTRLRNIYAA